MALSPCGKPLVPFQQHGTPIRGSWGPHEGALAACAECGYLVFDPLPTETQLADYYGSQYWEAGGGIEEARAAYAAGNAYDAVAGALIELWDSHGPAGAAMRLHEIGCGYGATVHHLRGRGVAATGSDLSVGAVEMARALGNSHTHTATLEAWRTAHPDNGVNAVFMSHSLEHMPDPAALAAQVLDMLPEGGLFVIRVPNGMALGPRARSFYEYTWLQYPDHIHYFTPMSSICLLERAGFEILSVTTLLREEHPGLFSATVASRPLDTLPDPVSLIRGACDNWLGMELQVIARRPATGTAAGAPAPLRAAAARFERDADRMTLAAPVGGDNLAAFRPDPDGHAGWRWTRLVDGAEHDLVPAVDGRRLIGEGVEIMRTLAYVPTGRAARLTATPQPRPPGALALRVCASAIMPHDPAGRFVLGVRGGGRELSRQELPGGVRHSIEVHLAPEDAGPVTFDLESVHTAYGTIHLHAAVRWIVPAS
jgi:SAM-dependent methyltransferase